MYGSIGSSHSPFPYLLPASLSAPKLIGVVFALLGRWCVYFPTPLQQMLVNRRVFVSLLGLSMRKYELTDGTLQGPSCCLGDDVASVSHTFIIRSRWVVEQWRT
jgi:hypothetical protein